MTSSRRFSAALLAAVLTVVMLFTVFFIALESNHDCPGEDCAVCALLQACESILRQAALAGAVLAGAELTRRALSSHALRTSGAFIPATPISLRVKLSD